MLVLKDPQALSFTELVVNLLLHTLLINHPRYQVSISHDFIELTYFPFPFLCLHCTLFINAWSMYYSWNDKSHILDLDIQHIVILLYWDIYFSWNYFLRIIEVETIKIIYLFFFNIWAMRNACLVRVKMYLRRCNIAAWFRDKNCIYIIYIYAIFITIIT